MAWTPQDRKRIAKTIREAREARGLTLDNVAELAKVNRNTVYAVEHAGPARAKSVIAIARSLKCQLGDFGIVTDDPQTQNDPLEILNCSASGAILPYTDVGRREWPLQFGLFVTGDEMAPELREGDLVVATPITSTQLRDNSLVVVKVRDSKVHIGRVRLIITSKGVEVILLRANGSYPALMFRLGDFERLAVVLEMRRRM